MKNALAELFYTSGTSANPKRCNAHEQKCISSRGARLSGIPHRKAEPSNSHTIPLFHANGWGVAHFLTLLGGKHVMMHRFETTEVFRLIEKEGRSFPAVSFPLWATGPGELPRSAPKYNLSSLRRIVIGGAASSPNSHSRGRRKNSVASAIRATA